jgi:hypothetical protein
MLLLLPWVTFDVVLSAVLVVAEINSFAFCSVYP